MSSCSRVFLAIVLVMSGLSFVLFAASGSIPRNAWLGAVLGLVCIIAGISCFPGRHTAVTYRLLGGTILAFCVGYLVYELFVGKRWVGGRGDPSVLNACLAFGIFGLPALYVIIHGCLPKWAGEIGKHFGKDPDEDADPSSDRGE